MNYKPLVILFFVFVISLFAGGYFTGMLPTSGNSSIDYAIGAIPAFIIFVALWKYVLKKPISAL